MRMLVTGATGLLGNNLVRMAIERGDQVRAIVRSGSPSVPLDDLPIERSACGLDDQDGLDRAAEGQQIVLHSAGFVRIGWSGLDEARRVNVEGTRRIARAARRAGARLVHISTVNTLALATSTGPADERTPIAGQVPCAYVVSKREAEAAVRDEIAQGLDAVIVHPGFMLGPWDWKPSSGKMLLEVARHRPPFAPAGGCSVVDVRDVARGVLAAAERGRCGEGYILAGVNLSYLALWKRMAKRAGVRGPIAPLLRPVGRGVGAVGDLWARLSGAETDINSAALRMGSQFHYYRSDKAARELDYRFGTVDDAIDAAWTWFVEHGYVGGRSARRAASAQRS